MMNKDKFVKLLVEIHSKILELNELQEMCKAETGKYYVISGSIETIKKGGK